MTPKRARRLLLIAFAISLLVHAIVLSGVRSPFGPYKDETQVVSIQHVRALRLSRQPTPPPPTPPVTPSPRSSAPSTASPNPHPAHTAGGAGNGSSKSSGASAQPSAASSVTPKPSPTPNCATSDTTALLAQTPEPPDIAPDARGDATSGTATVRVSLDETGAVQQTTVVQSSGNPSLDLVAVTMARTAHYTPATHACKPVASEYLFKARFNAW
ncbi:MAG: TonB family protein [Candidatus Eremiobacteraeota bacterium]|nr:TonB family protein [Candidatus Eremiobacteraeota bacterium]